ncbi:MAG TPA: LytTR family DNA-binding domain-containing protein [Saprospiraceae bacterium]|nr:LytTR family DNA-binding domain-containing protein [Saprospiraceae bacterium]
MKYAIPQKRLDAPVKILSLDTSRVFQKAQHHTPVYGVSPYPQGRLAIPGLGRIDMIELADILYVKAESNYVRIFLKDQGPVVMAKTLKQVSASLIAYGFLRVHQSFLVHPSIIKSYISKVGTIVLDSGDVLPVSRPNRKVVSLQLLNVSCI